MAVVSKLVGWQCDGCLIHRNETTEVHRDCVCGVEGMKDLVPAINEMYWNVFWDKNKYRFEMMLKVSADSAETMSPNAFERYLGECDNSGLDLERAKQFVLSFGNLKPYTRNRVESIYTDYVENK